MEDKQPYIKEVYTLEQLVEETGFNIQTLRIYIKEGTLKASKIGTRYLVSREQLLNWLKENEYKVKQG